MGRQHYGLCWWLNEGIAAVIKADERTLAISKPADPCAALANPARSPAEELRALAQATSQQGGITTPRNGSTVSPPQPFSLTLTITLQQPFAVGPSAAAASPLFVSSFRECTKLLEQVNVYTLLLLPLLLG